MQTMRDSKFGIGDRLKTTRHRLQTTRDRLHTTRRRFVTTADHLQTIRDSKFGIADRLKTTRRRFVTTADRFHTIARRPLFAIFRHNDTYSFHLTVPSGTVVQCRLRETYRGSCLCNGHRGPRGVER
jgi:hypothetical protein